MSGMNTKALGVLILFQKQRKQQKGKIYTHVNVKNALMNYKKEREQNGKDLLVRLR